MASNVPQPLPADVVALHIGPPKTGTTTLQGAFHACRDQLAEHSVHYAGARRQAMLAALAVTRTTGRKGDPPATPDLWEDLVEEVRAASGRRVLVSSEFFADASPEVVQEVVNRFCRDRVHVIVTLRPLAKILPSQWQQFVQNGLAMRYPDWLDHVLNKPLCEQPDPTFWRRHRHAELVERWANVVGPDRLTVIVLDESDRRMLLSTFEALLDVPNGLMVPEPGLPNRSLTQGEVEVIRLLNLEFQRRTWPDSLYGRIARVGVAKKMLAREPTPDEPQIMTPQWAQQRAAEIGAAAATAIDAMGVNVIGDLGGLGAVSAATPDSDADQPEDPPVPASAAAIAIVGTLLASRSVEWPIKAKRKSAKVAAAVDEHTLDQFSSADLLRTALARATRRSSDR